MTTQQRTEIELRSDGIALKLIGGMAVRTAQEVQAGIENVLDGGIEGVYEMQAKVQQMLVSIEQLKTLGRRMRWDAEYAGHDMGWSEAQGRYVDADEVEVAPLKSKEELLAEARAKYEQEIVDLAAEYTAEPNPGGLFAGCEPNQAMDIAVATINVSRRHEPASWAAIDAKEHAEMIAANSDDM